MNVSDEEVAASVASLSNSFVHSDILALLLLRQMASYDSRACSSVGNLVASSFAMYEPLGQFKKCKLPSGFAAKCDFSALATAMECCCPEWMEVLITSLGCW